MQQVKHYQPQMYSISPVVHEKHCSIEGFSSKMLFRDSTGRIAKLVSHNNSFVEIQKDVKPNHKSITNPVKDAKFILFPSVEEQYLQPTFYDPFNIQIIKSVLKGLNKEFDIVWLNPEDFL
jgi:hypothetical protein